MAPRILGPPVTDLGRRTSSATEEDPDPPWVTVFRGSRAASFEFGLVLDAKGMAYDRVASGDTWALTVAPPLADLANDELARYAAERVERPALPALVPFAGSSGGAIVYSLVLILTAYCAGIGLFGADWLAAGALDARVGAAGEWWRAVTALTLHLDQEHLLGNLLFGIGIGVLAGRVLGPGIAWLGILLAGASANYLDMLVSPSWHRAAGASTAVFAALGLLAGFGWRQGLRLRDRRLYRWAPLFAGVCLLALLGAGNEHVDVLGHLLGFLSGVVLGWVLARTGSPRSAALQRMAGCSALLFVCAAWFLALRHGR